MSASLRRLHRKASLPTMVMAAEEEQEVTREEGEEGEEGEQGLKREEREEGEEEGEEAAAVSGAGEEEDDTSV